MASLICLMVVANPAVAMSPDLAWWHSQPTEAQYEFVAGWLDCYWFDSGHRTNDKLTIRALTDTTSRRYVDTPTMRTVAIGRVLEIGALSTEFTGTWKAKPQPHGIFDGEYWRQIYPATARVAYVAGYFECRNQYLHDAQSARANDYAASISTYFGVSETDPAELNPMRGSESIAAVISKLRRRR